MRFPGIPVLTFQPFAQAELSIDSRGGGFSGGLIAWGTQSAPSGAVEKRLDNIFASDANADTELVERCLAGEEAAWENLVRLHTKRVYSIAYRFTNNDTQAQDLTQDVFLRVFRSLKSFRSGEGSFQVWLTRLTRNLLIDHYRRSKLERASDSLEDSLTVLESKTAVETRTDSRVVGREASELLQAALQKLSPELRETVILRDLEELEYREIAQALNVPEGTVKSRLNRGRAELARLLRRHKMTM
ncbi:MAG: sigma-70 family RNA polymerase sigma factor [Bryobacteraceae bacterium]|nr:sigma-70 family RNA polymerase sigma factor [Bryobacteraceae bacterium]